MTCLRNPTRRTSCAMPVARHLSCALAVAVVSSAWMLSRRSSSCGLPLARRMGGPALCARLTRCKRSAQLAQLAGGQILNFLFTTEVVRPIRPFSRLSCAWRSQWVAPTLRIISSAIFLNHNLLEGRMATLTTIDGHEISFKPSSVVLITDHDTFTGYSSAEYRLA